jgi:hypothetical protein
MAAVAAATMNMTPGLRILAFTQRPSPPDSSGTLA